MHTHSDDSSSIAIEKLPFATHDLETADHLSARLSRAKHAGERARTRKLDEAIQALQCSIDERELALEAAWDTPSTESDAPRDIECTTEAAEETAGNTVTLFDVNEVNQQLDGESPHSENGLAGYLEALAKPDAAQVKFVVASAASIQTLQSLLDLFPNFRLATEAIIGAAKLSFQSATPLRLPKFLLDGPPGIGKTEWVRALCTALDLPLVIVAMGSLDGRFELAGGHRTYKGAEPSLLIKGLLKAGVANPLFLFDEAELARPGLYQPLYQFVEDERFMDHFLEVQFLVAHVNIFLITNDRALLPDAIRSRSCELLIEEPSVVERAAIIERIYSHLRTTHTEYQTFPTMLDPMCLERLLNMSLRQVRIGLEVAMLRSTAAAVDTAAPKLNPDFILDAPSARTRPIGFVH